LRIGYILVDLFDDLFKLLVRDVFRLGCRLLYELRFGHFPVVEWRNELHELRRWFLFNLDRCLELVDLHQLWHRNLLRGWSRVMRKLRRWDLPIERWRLVLYNLLCRHLLDVGVKRLHELQFRYLPTQYLANKLQQLRGGAIFCKRSVRLHGLWSWYLPISDRFFVVRELRPRKVRNSYWLLLFVFELLGRPLPVEHRSNCLRRLFGRKLPVINGTVYL
jgi:hypothetical protein